VPEKEDLLRSIVCCPSGSSKIEYPAPFWAATAALATYSFPYIKPKKIDYLPYSAHLLLPT